MKTSTRIEFHEHTFFQTILTYFMGTCIFMKESAGNYAWKWIRKKKKWLCLRTQNCHRSVHLSGTTSVQSTIHSFLILSASFQGVSDHVLSCSDPAGIMRKTIRARSSPAIIKWYPIFAENIPRINRTVNIYSFHEHLYIWILQILSN